MRRTLFLLSIALGGAAESHGQYYSYVDVSSVFDQGLYAFGNGGVIVGARTFVSGVDGATYVNGTITDLGRLTGSSGSAAQAVSSSGVIAGYSNNHVVTFSGGSVSDLGLVPGAFAILVKGINSSGTIAGVAFESPQQGFVYSGGSATLTGLLPGANPASDTDFILGINDSGKIVGEGSVNGVYYAATVVNGAYTDMGWGPGSVATAINNAGQIIGQIRISGETEGVLWSNGSFINLGSLPGRAGTYPASINSSGAIVGGCGNRGFIYENGVMRDLNNFVAIPGDVVAGGYAINDSGQVVAVGSSPGNKPYLLNPIAVHFLVSVAPNALSGSPATVTVSAVDASNQIVTYYSGTIHFSSSDPSAALPADAALTQGTGAFQVTLNSPGTQTLAAADTQFPIINGTSSGVDVEGLVNITSQPASQSVALGSNATFSVTVSGSDNPTYQWLFNGAPIAGATAPTYTVTGVQVSNGGGYTVTISDAAGTVTSEAGILTVSGAGGPSITGQPSSLTVFPGETVILSVTTSPASTNAVRLSPDVSSAVAYQWYFNGQALQDGGGIAGSQTANLMLSGAGVHAGAYACFAGNTKGSALSHAATLQISVAGTPSRLVNLSCRALSGGGGSQLIAGFAVGGGGTDQVLVRADGPALAQFSVPQFLPDPDLQLFSTEGSPASLVASNSSWGGASAIAAAASAVGAFAWTDTGSIDSALVEPLSAGPYTANVSGKSGDTGIALVEVYDTTTEANFVSGAARLVNISARAQVGTGANILIAGFVIDGPTARTVLIRASGPALSAFGVGGALSDPKLDLLAGSQVLASNTGWGADAGIAAESASVGAFSWGSSATSDSAMLVTLPPGPYTAQVSGAAGDTGISLVEVYEVP